MSFCFGQVYQQLEGCIDDKRQFKTANWQTHLLHPDPNPDPDPNPNPDPNSNTDPNPIPYQIP